MYLTCLGSARQQDLQLILETLSIRDPTYSKSAKALAIKECCTYAPDRPSTIGYYVSICGLAGQARQRNRAALFLHGAYLWLLHINSTMCRDLNLQDPVFLVKFFCTSTLWAI